MYSRVCNDCVMTPRADIDDMDSPCKFGYLDSPFVDRCSKALELLQIAQINTNYSK